jgi:hypothetical protein
VSQNRIVATLFTIFGGVAVVLAAVGIYGVMSFAVSRRTQEFGVRMALGANTGRILSMVVRQGAVQVASGSPWVSGCRSAWRRSRATPSEYAVRRQRTRSADLRGSCIARGGRVAGGDLRAGPPGHARRPDARPPDGVSWRSERSCHDL